MENMSKNSEGGFMGWQDTYGYGVAGRIAFKRSMQTLVEQCDAGSLVAELEEFFNKCHGSTDGKFCAVEGDVAAPEYTGKKLKGFEKIPVNSGGFINRITGKDGDVFGKYSFLMDSNPNYPVEWQGIKYPSGEHALQASRTQDQELRKRIAMSSVIKAKQLAAIRPEDFAAGKDRGLISADVKTPRKNGEVKVEDYPKIDQEKKNRESIQRAKFDQNPVLKGLLVGTGNDVIAESKTGSRIKHDEYDPNRLTSYWDGNPDGTHGGEGKNGYGELLTKLRTDYKSEGINGKVQTEKELADANAKASKLNKDVVRTGKWDPTAKAETAPVAKPATGTGNKTETTVDTVTESDVIKGSLTKRIGRKKRNSVISPDKRTHPRAPSALETPSAAVRAELTPDEKSAMLDYMSGRTGIKYKEFNQFLQQNGGDPSAFKDPYLRSVAEGLKSGLDKAPVIPLSKGVSVYRGMKLGDSDIAQMRVIETEGLRNGLSRSDILKKQQSLVEQIVRSQYKIGGTEVTNYPVSTSYSPNAASEFTRNRRNVQGKAGDPLNAKGQPISQERDLYSGSGYVLKIDAGKALNVAPMTKRVWVTTGPNATRELSDQREVTLPIGSHFEVVGFSREEYAPDKGGTKQSFMVVHVRQVATEAGAEYYGLPVGSDITKKPLTASADGEIVYPDEYVVEDSDGDHGGYIEDIEWVN